MTMKPIAKIGDRVTILGYGMREFQVDAYTHEFHYDAENESEEIYYDLTCVKTFEYIFAGQEDISVIKGGGSDVSEITISISAEDVWNAIQKEDEEKATVDDLLLDLSDALELQRMFGDHEDDDKEDRKYALKVSEIKAQLIEMTKGGAY